MISGSMVRTKKPLRTTSKLLGVIVFLIGSGTMTFGAPVEFQYAVLTAPSSSDFSTDVPVSESGFDVGVSLYFEVWVQTTDPNGLSSASLDLSFDPSLVTALLITPSSVFSELTHGTIDNVNGRINDLSGSHLGSCVDAIAVNPIWTRVAIVEFNIVTDGILQIAGAATNSVIYGTAVCGVGDIDPENIIHNTMTVALGDAVIPAVSTWGVIALCLLILVAGTLVIEQRSCEDAS